MEIRACESKYRSALIATAAKTFVALCGAAAFLGACAHAPASAPPLHSPVGESRAEATKKMPVLEAVPGSHPVAAAAHWQKYNGRKKYVGNGHCARLVQDAVPALGNTRNWARGTHVYGNLSLDPGTPIATFEASGAYGNRRRGLSHAALYVRQDEAGLYMIDQWRPTRKSRGQRPRERFIPWIGGGEALPANSGLSYYVIHRFDPLQIGNADE